MLWRLLASLLEHYSCKDASYTVLDSEGVHRLQATPHKARNERQNKLEQDMILHKFNPNPSVTS